MLLTNSQYETNSLEARQQRVKTAQDSIQRATDTNKGLNMAVLRATAPTAEGVIRARLKAVLYNIVACKRYANALTFDRGTIDKIVPLLEYSEVAYCLPDGRADWARCVRIMTKAQQELFRARGIDYKKMTRGEYIAKFAEVL